MPNFLGRPSNSPIANLNVDLLWKILLMNADMEYDPPIENRETRKFRALNEMRSASQVSLHWRTLILASPSLWARVVDLELLTLGKDEWRQEVMQRTGKALLVVKGIISEFFREWRLSLIKDNWSRIRKLHITVTMRGTDIKPMAFDFLFQPTKYLESFVFRMPAQQDPLFTLNDKLALFANEAPSLRDFRSHHVPLNPKAPWLSQIRRLRISDTIYEAFDTTETLYRVLEEMTLLESLHIINAISSVADNISRPPINLSNLQEIKIVDSDMGICWAVLRQIVPQIGCSVNITSFENLLVTAHDDRLQGSDCLSLYAKTYFGTHHPLFVLLRATPLHFKLTGAQNPQGADAWRHPTFDIDIQLDDQLSLVNFPISFLILSTIFSCSFSSVTNLDLEMDILHKDQRDPNFHRFLLSFSSVEVLKTTAVTLELLCTCFVDISANFPRLKVLKMAQVEWFFSSFTAPFFNVLSVFLSRRKEAGVAIETLDINLSWNSAMKDLGFLENISGLKVIWRYGAEEGEYFCGNGKPGELDFTNKFTPFLDEEEVA